MRLPELYIGESPEKGRGVFTRHTIPAESILEIAPVIVMSKADREYLDKTPLHDYIFEWGVENDQCAMALGWIPIYNHSYASNCEYFMDFDAAQMFVKSVRNINAEEEITINYNGDWNDSTTLWFDAK